MQYFYPFVGRNGKVAVVQTFDYEADSDFEQQRFYYDNYGEKLYFLTEQSCVDWIKENILKSAIDDEILENDKSNDIWQDLLKDQEDQEDW